MAYTKNDWACGDKITADKLNRMEQGIEDAQNGYECTQGEVTLVSSETISTSEGNAVLSYTNLIDADTLIVYFDGTRYECPKISHSDYNAYGGYTSEDTTDFSEYPFAIRSAIQTEVPTRRNIVYAQTAGSHTIELKAVEESINTTECFEKAVKKFTGYECTQGWVTLTEETVDTIVSELQPTIATGDFSYNSHITADEIQVIYDGTTYNCEKVQGTDDEFSAYGGANADGMTYDFSEYPFAIGSVSDSIGVLTSLTVPSGDAGSHTVEILAPGLVATTTPCFQKAVESVVGNSGGRLIKKVGASSCNSDYNEYDISLNEVKSLLSQGTPMMIETTSSGETVYQQVLFCHTSVDRVSFVVANADISGSDPSTTLTSGILYSNNGADAHMDSGYCSGPL